MTTIPTLPTAPSRASPSTFSVDGDAWVAALAAWTTATNTVAEEIMAAAGADFTGTSTTSLAIGTGSKSFTTQADLSFSAGQFIIAASAAGPTNYMIGNITSYNTGSGALVMNCTAVGGSGTLADWQIGLIPPSLGLLLSGGTMTGGLVLAAGTTSIVPIRFTTGVTHSTPTHGDVNATATTISIYLNGAWYQFAPVPECTNAEGWAGDSTSTVLTPRRLFTLADAVTLTDGATITPDFDTGLNFKVTLGGNRTLANPSNTKDGQSGFIRVTQDGTGSRTFAYGSNWRFPGGAAAGGVLSTAASSVDIIGYAVEDGLIYASLQKAFAA